MDLKEEPLLQKGKKRKRTAITRNSKHLSKDPASPDLPQSESQTIPSIKKKTCLSQAVGQETIGNQGNRTILEVMMMCFPADVLKSLCLVNRLWMEICSSNELSKELWNTILEDLYIPPDNLTHPKTTCASYIRQKQTVADLQRNRMQILDKKTGEWTSNFLSELMPKKLYSYAVLFDGSLLCCGGINIVDFQPRFENRAYRVALDGEVSPLEPMVTGRHVHGIAAYGRKVFVFGGGGLGRQLLTIEQYDETSWSELPAKMNASHAGFAPSLYKGLIYLCDSFARPIEVFDPKSLTVGILARIRTPDEFCNVVTGYKGCILAIGGRKVWKWNCETNDSKEVRKPNYRIWGISKRIVLQGDTTHVLSYPTTGA